MSSRAEFGGLRYNSFDIYIGTCASQVCAELGCPRVLPGPNLNLILVEGSQPSLYNRENSLVLVG